MSNLDLTRRQFLKTTAVATAAAGAGMLDVPPATAADGASLFDRLRELAGSRWWWTGLRVDFPSQINAPGPFSSSSPGPYRFIVHGSEYDAHWFRANVACGTWWNDLTPDTKAGKHATDGRCCGTLYGDNARRFLAVLTAPNPHHVLWCGMVTKYKLAVRQAGGPPLRDTRACHRPLGDGYGPECGEHEYTECAIATRYSTVPLGQILVPTAWLHEAPLPADRGHSPMGWLAQVTTRIKQVGPASAFGPAVHPPTARWLSSRASRIADELDRLEDEYKRPSLGFAMYVNPRAVARLAFRQDLLLYGGALLAAGGPRLVHALERTQNRHALDVAAAWHAGTETIRAHSRVTPRPFFEEEA